MGRITSHRAVAVVAAAALLASLAAATVASPATAAKPKPTCQGLKATIVGTKKADRLVGTAKRDIIVAKGGHDRIYGKGGNDVICAGPGNDVVVGGPGADRLWGQLGHDKLFGNVGPDFLAGQAGNDTLVGGIGVDTCFQGTGAGLVATCERPAPPASPPTGPALIPLTGILAVAYSDIDGLPGYSTGDVMIALLRDTNGDGVPSVDDRVEMGRYPTDLAGSAFADWGTKSHVVTDLDTPQAEGVALASAAGLHQFVHDPGRYESFVEAFAEAGFMDGFADGEDAIEVPAAALSQPSQPVVPVLKTTRTTDDGFIDVELNYVVR